jgi:adenosine kinase
VAGIQGSRIVIANEYEFELIRGKTGLDVDDVLGLAGGLIVTRGPHGSIIRADGEVHVIPAVPARAEVDPTGVGDAYRAGVLFGMLHELDWPTAGRVGSLAATYALEAMGTQTHHYTRDEFLNRYAVHFGPPPPLLAAALRGAELPIVA